MSEEFEETNLIVIVGKDHYQANTIEEMNEKIIGKDFNFLSEHEKYETRKKIVFPHALLKNIKDTKKIKIDTDIDFYLTLCELDVIKLLENVNSEIFLKKFEKRSYKGNYVIINELLKKDI